jgi:hypothetical protein
VWEMRLADNKARALGWINVAGPINQISTICSSRPARFYTSSLQLLGTMVSSTLTTGHEGNVMRAIIALAMAAAVIALGGCFHHRQVYSDEVLAPPPLPHPPIK